MNQFGPIQVGGGDTATPLNVQKRLALIRRFLPPHPARFIDSGCGAGAYVQHLIEEFGLDAFGIEFAPDKVSLAHRNPNLQTRIREGDLQKMPYNDASFDIALLNEVLEHVPDEHAAIREIHRILKPGARLIVFSPNRFFPFETHGVTLRGFDWNAPCYLPFIPYIPLWAGRLVFRYWARNYWPSELRKLFVQNGFEIVACDYLWQTFENISHNQPWFIRRGKGGFRRIANFLEKIPIIRTAGASQAIILKKI